MDTVMSIVDSDLCNGCCECLSACARNNISIIYSPRVGHPVPMVAAEHCSLCGSCFRACKQGALFDLRIS